MKVTNISDGALAVIGELRLIIEQQKEQIEQKIIENSELASRLADIMNTQMQDKSTDGQ